MTRGQRAELLASLRRYIWYGVERIEAERVTWSRELHDGLGQELGLALVKTALVRRRLPAGHEASEALDDLERQIRRCADQLRSISHRMRPDILEQAGLVEVVRSLFEDHLGDTHTLDLRLPERTLPLDSSAALHVFRCLQESVRNIQKHAHATQVALVMEVENAWLEIRISDDGVGAPDTAVLRGIGWTGMRERMLLVGGSVERTRVHPGGFGMRLRVPLGRAA